MPPKNVKTVIIVRTRRISLIFLTLLLILHTWRLMAEDKICENIQMSVMAECDSLLRDGTKGDFVYAYAWCKDNNSKKMLWKRSLMPMGSRSLVSYYPSSILYFSTAERVYLYIPYSKYNKLPPYGYQEGHWIFDKFSGRLLREATRIEELRDKNNYYFPENASSQGNDHDNALPGEDAEWEIIQVQPNDQCPGSGGGIMRTHYMTDEEFKALPKENW